jgi:hypothetical protein
MPLPPRDFGGNIVGLDVDVGAALILHALSRPTADRRFAQIAAIPVLAGNGSTRPEWEFVTGN